MLPQDTTEDIASFERGIDRESARTDMKKGGYEAASNVLLRSDDSGRHISAMFADEVLDSLVTWPSGNPIWFAPFTYPVYNATTRVLSYITQLVIMRDTGQMHTYVSPTTSGVAGTVANVRRGFVGSELQTNHFVFDKWLCTVDGRNAPMKYGQHFLWSGQLEATPFMYPLGSKPVTPFVPGLAGETVTFINGGGFTPDASIPGGGARLGTHAARVGRKSGSAGEVRVAFTAAHNFTAGPQPYGGDDFDDTDYVILSCIAATEGTTTGTIRLRFESTPGNHYEFTFTPAVSNTAWKTLTAVKSTKATTGAPNWNSITKVSVFNDDTALDVIVDDLYFLYTDAPPAVAVGTSHKNRIVAGGAPVGATPGEPYLSTLVYSKAGLPDNYPSANSQNISGGFESLAKTNAINSVREFGDTVIIGCPNAIFSWTVGDSGNPVKSTISTEQGIDSHRGMVETPQGSLLFQWQRGAYILRSTGRQYVSPKIAPILANAHLNDPSWTISVVDERTKTVRTCFREGDDPSQCSNGFVFDFSTSQEVGEPIYPATFTSVFDWAVAAYVNGRRETLYATNSSPQIYRLHINRTGSTLAGSFTTQWIARTKSMLTRWLGVAIPYVADVPITVDVRYANVPGEFNGAVYLPEHQQTLEANPEIDSNGRITFAGSSKWVQLRFTWSGFAEIYPPLSLFGLKTEHPQ